MLLDPVKSGPLIKSRQFTEGPRADHSLDTWLCLQQQMSLPDVTEAIFFFFVMEDKIVLCFGEL